MASLDLLTMAESGLAKVIVGEWEISHDTETAVWGRAVVKGIQEGVILTNKVQPCTFRFSHRVRPQIKDIYKSMVTIEWGAEAGENYATLETAEPGCLTWRLPSLADGTLGELTVWRKMLKAAEEVEEERAKAAQELADIRAQAAEELEEECAKAADELAEARSKASMEVAEVHAKVAAEVDEVRAEAALHKEQTNARMKVVLSEAEQACAKAAISEELAEARAKVADEIADENESLRVQLNSQVASSESLREQLQSLRMLVVEMMAQSLPSKAHLLKELVEEKAYPTGNKSVRQQDTTPDKELPPEKKRRTDAAGKENVPLGWSLASCGA